MVEPALPRRSATSMRYSPPRRSPRAELERARSELGAAHVRPANRGERVYGREMLRLQAGSAPVRANVGEDHRVPECDGQRERGPHDLAAPFAVAPIDSQI